MNIINKDEIMDNCLDRALTLVATATEMSDDELHDKVRNDAKFYKLVRHIAEMYFELETNELFITERQRVADEWKRLVRQIEI